MVTFYRGGWCPYCNVQLRAYQQVLGEITRLGAKLVAISPQLPNGSMSTAEVNRLSFNVLDDIGNRVARSFGLVYSLPQELRAALTYNDKTLPSINGDNSWELPATYVVAPDRKIARRDRTRLPRTAGARRDRRGAPRAALRRDQGRLNTPAYRKDRQ